MNTRATAILGGVAVVVLVLGLYFGLGGREQQAEVPAARPAFSGLAGKLADAAAIEVSQAGKTLELKRSGDGWTLPDKGGYAARASHVHELLAGLAELKLAEPRTANADDYARLGVEDPPKQAPKDPAKEGAAAGATLIRVLDGGGAPIAQLLLGHAHTGSGGNGDGIYVRKPGDAQAWLAEGHVTAETDPMEWIDKDVASIPPGQIAGVTVTRGGQTLVFARADGKLGLQSPAEHPKLDQFKIDDVGRALDSLTLDDVKPAPAPGTPEGQVVFATGDGTTVTASVSKDGGDIWATFAVAFAAPEKPTDQKPTDQKPTDQKAADDQAKDAKATEEKAKQAADALAVKLKGWAYKLGSWKEAALVPTLDDLKAYQPPPPAAKPAAPAAAAPAPAAATPAPAAPADAAAAPAAK